MVENLADYYFEALSKTTSPGRVLNKMYNELFGTETSVSRIKTFNKLVRLFGRFEIYFALIELKSWVDNGWNFDTDRSPYPILYKIIISRLEEKLNSRSESLGVDLSKYVKNIEKEKKKIMRNKPNIPETWKDG